VKDVDAEVCTEVDEGLMVTLIAGVVATVMVAEADLVVLATEVASKVTVAGFGTAVGAV
jgi:hypothetical protein